MIRIALQMLWHKPARFVFTAFGMATLFFLSVAQVGLMVGWINTISAIIRHAEVDVWVMAEQTPSFDYGTAIPRQRLYQVRSVEGVAWAEAMLMAWNIWQRPDGRRVNVEMVGLDDSNVGGPWRMTAGKVEDVHLPDSVIVDEMFVDALGVRGLGDEVELIGDRAIVRGLSRQVRTFTASPFVFTSIRSAIRYDKRYQQDEITYVMARRAPGHSPEQLADAIRREVPSVEALTSDQFARRSVTYWMLETGIGITIILTAVLGMLVSSVVGSQTLFGVTNDHLQNYATLLAVGFSRGQLLACRATERTPIPLEMTPEVFVGVLAASALGSLMGSLLSLKAVWSIDPVAVFRG
jgi:putative ABC transport system permease protein